MSDDARISDGPKQSSKRVLLVDDDEVQLDSLSKYLNRMGFVTITCEDGDEAVAALEGFPIDVLVCDVQMPRMNGLSVLNWVQENRPELKVVMMTAYSSYELYQIATEKGSVIYLEKPVDPKLLVEILRGPPVEKGGQQIVNACLEASKEGANGEVVVRSKDAVGRIFFAEGKAVFATHSKGVGAFMTVLKSRSSIDREVLEETAVVCKKEGLNIIDAIVDKSLLSEDEMRGILMESISQSLADMLHWDSCKALFLPVSRPFEGRFSFSFEDVLAHTDQA